MLFTTIVRNVFTIAYIPFVTLPISDQFDDACDRIELAGEIQGSQSFSNGPNPFRLHWRSEGCRTGRSLVAVYSVAGTEVSRIELGKLIEVRTLHCANTAPLILLRHILYAGTGVHAEELLLCRHDALDKPLMRNCMKRMECGVGKAEHHRSWIMIYPRKDTSNVFVFEVDASWPTIRRARFVIPNVHVGYSWRSIRGLEGLDTRTLAFGPSCAELE